MPEKTEKSAKTFPRYVLTTDCPDTTGVVAAIAGFLARNNGLITEAQHFDDEVSVRSFMRTVFHDNGKGMPPIAALESDFAESVAAPFGMTWAFRDLRKRCRVVVGVSKTGHCLNSMLHRWSTGALPVDIDRKSVV